MLLRRANSADLPQIVALERLPEARRYVGQWPDDHHARALAGRDARYYVHADDHGRIQAYVILLDFEEGHDTFIARCPILTKFVIRSQNEFQESLPYERVAYP